MEYRVIAQKSKHVPLKLMTDPIKANLTDDPDRPSKALINPECRLAAR